MVLASIRDIPDDYAGDLLSSRSPTRIAQFWQEELSFIERETKDWVDEGRRLYERFRSERRRAQARNRDHRRFNILFSNTQTLQAALYGKMAKPDVRRRFADRDPVARAGADVIERALIYVTEVGDIDTPIESGLLDYLLPGRGVIRVDYEPTIATRPTLDMFGQPVLDEDGEQATEEYIADQQVRAKYVFWEDFRHAASRGWDGVWWIAFRHTFTRDELRTQVYDAAPPTSKTYGKPEDVPLNWSPDHRQGMTYERTAPAHQHHAKAEVWEIWHRPGKTRYWVVEGFGTPLRMDEDPLGLDKFYPVPEPIWSYRTTETLLPRPEFAAYEDQADDLDEITRRISVLTRALKRRGVYDQSMKELARLSGATDNTFIPVENWNSLTAKGGLGGVFQTEDIAVVAQVLLGLYQQSDRLVQKIYEVTGIADILRGSSDPDETYGAQKIKAQFGSARLKKRQRVIQRWVCDTYRLKAEIITKHFTADILSQMTGINVTPDIAQILQNSTQRGYRIDIETDSTIYEEAAAQQQQRSGMLTALTQFVVAWTPILGQRPQLLPLAFEMIKWAIRVYPQSRELEEAVEEAEAALLQVAQQAAANPQPNPMLQIAQIKASSEAAKAQASVQSSQVEAQAKAQQADADMQHAAATVQAQREKHTQEMQQSAAEHAMDMQMARDQHIADMTSKFAAGPGMGANPTAPAGFAPPNPPAAPPAPPAFGTGLPARPHVRATYGVGDVMRQQPAMGAMPPAPRAMQPMRPPPGTHIGPAVAMHPAAMRNFTPPRLHPNGNMYVQHIGTGQHFQYNPGRGGV